MYRELAPGRVLLDHGPISMVIEAFRNGQPFTRAAVAGVETAVKQLAKLCGHLDVARTPVCHIHAHKENYPAVLKRMIEAARATGEPDITPMAAVAGAIAEMALESAAKKGATRVVANNGGDIALRVEPGKSLRVGVVTDLAAKKVTHYFDVSGGSGICGVATSGLGGRSLTKGIASAVVVAARTAALADACATMVGNAVAARHPGIIMVPAEEIDPLTDIKGHLVTKSVGVLDEDTIKRALDSGREKAVDYLRAGLIKAVVLAVRGTLWMYPQGFAGRLAVADMSPG